MPEHETIDLTQDSDDESPRPASRDFRNENGVFVLQESSEDDSEIVPLPSLRKSNPQPRKGTPRNAKESSSTSSPTIPRNVRSKTPTSLSVPPRGRQRSGQSSRDAPVSASALADPAISTPRRASKSSFQNSSGPQIKQSPQTFSRYNNQRHPSSKGNVEDDSLFPSERAGNVPRSSRRGSSQGERMRSESMNSAGATPRSSSRLAVKTTLFSRPAGKSSPAIEKSKTQGLSSTRRAPSDKEDSTYESEPESESDEEPIDPTLGDIDIPVPLDMPAKRVSRSNTAFQKSIPDIDPTRGDNDLPIPSDVPSKRSSRNNPSLQKSIPDIDPSAEDNDIPTPADTPSRKIPGDNAAYQRPIPDSVADSGGMSSPVRTRKDQATLQVPRTYPKRNESPREVMGRNKGKEREPTKEQQTQTISQLEESLRAFQRNMNDDHALTVRHLLRDARKAETAREQLFIDDVSPFPSQGAIQISQKDPFPKGAKAERFKSIVSWPSLKGREVF